MTILFMFHVCKMIYDSSLFIVEETLLAQGSLTLFKATGSSDYEREESFRNDPPPWKK
jgi:hypothetical protein